MGQVKELVIELCDRVMRSYGVAAAHAREDSPLAQAIDALGDQHADVATEALRAELKDALAGRGDYAGLRAAVLERVPLAEQAWIGLLVARVVGQVIEAAAGEPAGEDASCTG